MSSSSRDAILQRLKSQKIDSVDLPDSIHGDWIRYEDPVAQLGKSIQGVGGAFETVDSIDGVVQRLSSFPQYQNAQRLLSLVDGIPNHVDLESVAHPKDLEDLDFVIVPGSIAVAENGAVWVTDERLKHRVVYFINQHLVIVVHRSAIVHTMHEAYAKLEFTKPQFGCFISGPSKTADIEQSLVIGAHGCRSMQMYVVP